jgi:hypothetical protein
VKKFDLLAEKGDLHGKKIDLMAEKGDLRGKKVDLLAGNGDLQVKKIHLLMKRTTFYGQLKAIRKTNIPIQVERKALHLTYIPI